MVCKVTVRATTEDGTQQEIATDDLVDDGFNLDDAPPFDQLPDKIDGDDGGERLKIRATSDGQSFDSPFEDLFDAREAAKEGEPPDLWQERDRMTETITVSGVEIDRIVEVEFEKPTGMRIRLVFNESPNHDGGGV